MVCPYDLDAPGGVQNQSRGLASALVARGHEVTLLAPGAGGRSEVAGFRLELLGGSLGVRTNGSVAPIAPFPGVRRATRRLLAEHDYDVVHLQEPFVPGPSLFALLAAEVPVVGTFHRAGAGAGYRALRPLLSRLVRRVDRCVAVSAAAAATLQAVSGAEAGEVLANGVDTARFHPGELRPVASRVVFAGRHEERKGLGVLLEAFGLLEGDLELTVIGSGPQTEVLQGASRDPRVTWLGRVGDDVLASTLESADLFVAPSLHGESFGVVLLEAMAAGCAVLASDLEGYRLAAGEAACFFPPGDVTALAAALGGLLADPAARQALRVRGQARAEAHSFARLAASYESIYAALLR